MNYLNEFDPQAAAWLRTLADEGLIPPCEIDTRSIEDVEPRELAGYTQCHFFAGIGGWPLALQLSGWPADRPIWTGSCPCQPFSAAGKGAGFDDQRHLWPAFHWLISQCRPSIVVGEQVASAAVGPWIDLVLTDLEALGYASGAYAGPAAGVGAPHIRDRSFWVADARGSRSSEQWWRRHKSARPTEDGVPIRLADAGLHDDPDQSRAARLGEPEAQRPADQPGRRGAPPSGLADAELQQRPHGEARIGDEHAAGGRVESTATAAGLRHDLRPGPVNGHWRDADWLGCRDGKWRPVEPGTFPLAHGLPARVGRLRGYGNAIVPQQAAEFIKAVMAYADRNP